MRRRSSRQRSHSEIRLQILCKRRRTIHDLGSLYHHPCEPLLPLPRKGTLCVVSVTQHDLINPSCTGLVVFPHACGIHEQVNQLLSAFVYESLRAYSRQFRSVVSMTERPAPEEAARVVRSTLTFEDGPGERAALDHQSFLGHVLACFRRRGPHHWIARGAVSHGDEGVHGLGCYGTMSSVAVIDAYPVLVNVKLNSRRRMRRRMVIMRFRDRVRIVEKLLSEDGVLRQTQVGGAQEVASRSIKPEVAFRRVAVLRKGGMAGTAARAGEAGLVVGVGGAGMIAMVIE
mmetsp:Transcript_1299/g.2807  ORF Transcript_1299/g.2807 Transcript_1299/m.2807 type:complete len:287 (-) Transcript_1299:613-1473(-)